MAPEQIRSRQVDARTDIYSIGVVLYEMLSGTRAFPSKQLLDVIEKRKTNDYVPLNQFCVNLPKRIYRLVNTCMELQAEDRYQNINELMKTISSIYKRYSDEDPQAIIQQYIDTGTIPLNKIHISRQILIPIIAAVIPTILLIATLMFLVFTSHTPKNEKVAVSTPPPEVTTKERPAPEPVAPNINASISLPEVASSQKVPLNVSGQAPASVPAPQLPSQKAVSQQKVPKPAPKQKRVVAASSPVPTSDPITAIQSLVEGGDLSAALRRLRERKINDGAYYALYARCYYESGNWEKAYELAETATRITSKHMSRSQRKGQFLLYKAKWFSTRFDELPSPDAAEEAISAWWDVREHFDGTEEAAKASFAESEINRISTFLNE
jgi:serine/threonine protein kinase